MYLGLPALLLVGTKQGGEQLWHGGSPAPYLPHQCWSWDWSCFMPHV